MVGGDVALLIGVCQQRIAVGVKCAARRVVKDAETVIEIAAAEKAVVGLLAQTHLVDLGKIRLLAADGFHRLRADRGKLRKLGVRKRHAVLLRHGLDPDLLLRERKCPLLRDVPDRLALGQLHIPLDFAAHVILKHGSNIGALIAEKVKIEVGGHRHAIHRSDDGIGADARGLVAQALFDAAVGKHGRKCRVDAKRQRDADGGR